MGYRVRFKEKALHTLDALYAYISERDKGAARAVVGRLHAFFVHLSLFPYLGRQTDKSGVYRFPVGKTGMVVFYTFDKEVTVIRIEHVRQSKR